MAKKKKKPAQKILEVEIINRRAKKYRKINLTEKEIVIYNKDLGEFQLLPQISASYDENCEPCEPKDG
tara:strand:+ start:178 stop:381 length:204 start_codon:yes stop_codon:yes gene_type:complete